MSNTPTPAGCQPDHQATSRRPAGWGGAVTLLILVALASPTDGALRLLDLAIEDATTREVVERYTLVRQLKPVRFMGTIKTTDWIMDRPPFAATLARHLHPPLEPYHITHTGNGLYTVDDRGALRGTFRLVARGPERRVYFAHGQFRSLAHLFKLSGGMVFALEYRERQDGNQSYVEVNPQLFVRLDNILAHGILKILAPLLHGIIDRRVANLTEAAQIVSRRLTKDPWGLYQEIQTWPDVRPEEREEYRRAVQAAFDVPKEGG